MMQNKEMPPAISIDGTLLDVVEDFTYLGSKISSTLSLEKEIQSRIGKAVSVMARLNQRVWNNAQLTDRTKFLFTRPACSAHSFMEVRLG